MSSIIDFLELTSKLYKCKLRKTRVYYELLRMSYITTVSRFVQQIYERTRRPFNKPNSSSTLCMPMIYRHIKTESASTKVTVTYNRSSFKIRQRGVLISTDLTSTLPSHYPNQCCLIFNRTLWNKLQYDCNFIFSFKNMPLDILLAKSHCRNNARATLVNFKFKFC